MNLNQLLVWFVICICIVLLIRALLFRQKKGWFIVYGLILGVTVAMSYLAPTIAGFIGGSLWGLFVFLPLIGFLKVNQMVDEQRYAQAYRLANYLRWVHPADGWLEQPDILKALEMGKQGEIQPAFQILNRYPSVSTKASRRATVLLYAMEARWEELLVWLMVNLPEKVLLRDGDLTVYYLRALGETGDINGLLRVIKDGEKQLQKSGNTINLNLARLYALAFSGEIPFVQKLLESNLAVYSHKFQAFWLATSQMTAGNITVARQQLSTLKQDSNRALNKAISWRLLQSENFHLPELTPASIQIISNLKSSVRQENRYDVINPTTNKRPYATYILIALNIIIFAVEIALLDNRHIVDFLFWGIRDIQCTQTDCISFLDINAVLNVLGGLIPQEVNNGQWWRLINANFLHFGLIHLVMNMLGLYVLGPFVEFTLGARRYLFAYFGSGIGAMLVFTIRHLSISSPEQMLVGASAAVIGLLGVIVAILLQGWVKERSRVAGKRLRIFFIMIAIQIMVDSSIPEISGESHIFGLVMGFLIGSLLLIKLQVED